MHRCAAWNIWAIVCSFVASVDVATIIIVKVTNCLEETVFFHVYMLEVRGIIASSCLLVLFRLSAILVQKRDRRYIRYLFPCLAEVSRGVCGDVYGSASSVFMCYPAKDVVVHKSPVLATRLETMSSSVQFSKYRRFLSLVCFYPCVLITPSFMLYSDIF